MSWPLTSWFGNERNMSWVKPYWSAACYVVSRGGAASLLGKYWRAVSDAKPDEVLIDTRSQRYAAADALLFNGSDVFVAPPIMTQRVQGRHSESSHESNKMKSRQFVLRHVFGGQWAAADLPLRAMPFHVVVFTWQAASTSCSDRLQRQSSSSPSSSSSSLSSSSSSSSSSSLLVLLVLAVLVVVLVVLVVVLLLLLLRLLLLLLLLLLSLMLSILPKVVEFSVEDDESVDGEVEASWSQPTPCCSK